MGWLGRKRRGWEEKNEYWDERRGRRRRKMNINKYM
jgi:hypothetical protein